MATFMSGFSSWLGTAANAGTMYTGMKAINSLTKKPGKGKKAPPPDESALQMSRRRSYAQRAMTSGRASTMLSDRENLGG